MKNHGLRKKTTIALWVLLIGSLLFGVYKNFTAIDRHTVHEEKVIKTKIVDTHAISSFVEDFAKVFYSWEPTKESLGRRTEELSNYLTEDLEQLNQDMIRTDIPTRSMVKQMKIWKVNQLNNTDFQVVFSLLQEIEESKEKMKEKRTVESAFSVQVRTYGTDQLVILTNPVMASVPRKLIIKSQPLQDDMTVEQGTKDEIQSFLNTFFKVYPSAKKTELLYYVKDKNIKEISKDYVFSEIKQINFYEAKNDAVEVKVVAVYLDKDTQAILQFTYDLIVEKDGEKWVIKKIV